MCWIRHEWARRLWGALVVAACSSEVADTGPIAPPQAEIAYLRLVALDTVSGRPGVRACDTLPTPAPQGSVLVRYRRADGGWAEHMSSYPSLSVEMSFLEPPAEGSVVIDGAPCYLPVTLPLVPLLHHASGITEAPEDTIRLARQVPWAGDVTFELVPVSATTAEWTVRGTLRVLAGATGLAPTGSWMELARCSARMGDKGMLYGCETEASWQRVVLTPAEWELGPAADGAIPVTIVARLPRDTTTHTFELQRIRWQLIDDRGRATWVKCVPETFPPTGKAPCW